MSVCISWGMKGAPLLPKVFAETLSNTEMPNWALTLLGHGSPCTAAVLCDPLEPGSFDGVDARLINLATNLAKAHMADVETKPALARGWNPDLDPNKVPWATRTFNCLNSEGLLTGGTSQLEQITIEDLLAIPGMGIRSVLDFASTAEAVMTQIEIRLASTSDDDEGDLSEQIKYLLAVSQRSWADQVHARDPRFARLLEGNIGTLSSRIENVLETMGAVEVKSLYESVQKIEVRLEEISLLHLESALEDLLCQLAPRQAERLDKLIQRFGWSGAPPITLEKCGELLGVTRERIRQIQSKILKKIPRSGLYLPQLSRAARILEDAAPMSADEAASLLQKRGISNRPFSPESVLSAAESLHKPASFQVKTIRGQRIVIADEGERAAAKVFTIARAQSGSSGATNVTEVLTQLQAEEGVEISAVQATALLGNSGEVDFLDQSWFWMPDIPAERNRLRNVTRRMLSVASPISIPALRGGIRRVYTFRNSAGSYKWALLVPPVSVLAEWYSRHPEFTVDEKNYVGHLNQLDYKQELGEADQILVESLRSSPSGLMDRLNLREMCLAKGLNPNTFEISLSYSAVVDHVDTNIWSLRGVPVDQACVAAVRELNAQRPKVKRVQDFGWTEDGRIWITILIPAHVHNAVFGIPAPMVRMLKDQRFSAFNASGQDVGRVSINDEGTAYGFQSFLKQAGADEGDTFLLEFELDSQTVTLRVGDESVIPEDTL